MTDAESNGAAMLTQAMVRRIPGVLLVALVALPAVLGGDLILLVGGPILGILLGMVVQAVRAPGQQFRPGIGFVAKYVLQASVVLLGLGLGLGQLWSVGKSSFPVLVGSLAAALVAAGVVGKLMGIERDLKILIGSGTAICGGSAIAATSAAIGASEAAIAYSMTTIFTFNAMAIVTFPFLGHALDLSQSAFGLWAGTAINDTSSVVAAGYTFGATAGAYAVIVKLARTTMIIPLTVALSIDRARRAARSESADESAGRLRWNALVPWFVVWFVVATCASSAGLVPGSVTRTADFLVPVLITLALTAVGLSADFSQIRVTGFKPLAFGGLLWVVVASSSLVLQAATGLL